jgi:GT2 family glycosyltransferase
MARGEILAFIDSDAFPSVSWLKNAVKYFESADVAAVGGPGITPESDSLMQKASGEILSSLFGGGGLSFRYAVKELRKSDDLPTVNLLVRKSVLEELGGFDSSYWPGEDTYFCLLVTRKLGGKILYAPDVVAFHHRRSLFIPHLKQVASYGLHRGYFAKRFPETSRRIAYFLPSILAVGLPIGLALALLNSIFRTIFLSALTLYVLASFLTGLAAGLRRKSLRIWAAVFLGIIMTHICYGLSFIRGLCSRKLPR